MKHDELKDSILDENLHRPLINGLRKYTENAGLGDQIEYVYASMKKLATEREIKFAEKWPAIYETYTGAFYLGEIKDPTVQRRMKALTGMFVRNFMNARLATVGDILEDPSLDARIVLIPDFCLIKQTLSDYQREKLLQFLNARIAKGKFTVLYIESPEAFVNQFGPQLFNEIKGAFLKL